MSNFEIFLIVMACLVPVFALIMIMPKIKIKLKKKEKKVQLETKTYEEIKKEDTQQKPPVEEKPKEVKKQSLTSNEFSNDDFKSYLNRRKSTNRPSRVNLPDDFIDRTSSYSSRRRRRADQPPKSIEEEIKNLSPELKAMIFAGILEKRNYD